MEYGISVLPLLLSVSVFVVSTAGFFSDQREEGGVLRRVLDRRGGCRGGAGGAAVLKKETGVKKKYLTPVSFYDNLTEVMIDGSEN